MAGSHGAVTWCTRSGLALVLVHAADWKSKACIVAARMWVPTSELVGKVSSDRARSPPPLEVPVTSPVEPLKLVDGLDAWM